VRTLHIGLHVKDVERSLAFYTAVGYEVVGRVPETPIGMLTMIKLPDDPFVTVELVARAPDGDVRGLGTLSHLVIQVESLEETVAALATKGVSVDGPDPSGSPDETRTAWIVDPDGNRIELVQWPRGHSDGMTAADFSETGDGS
jgi:lactoylglutathione lyase